MDSPAPVAPQLDDEAGSQAEPRTTVTTALAALGIVYGDLGTSPLYTYQTIVGTVGGHPTAAEAVGLLSLVVWALIITVSLKYCVFVMRADNHGEGGILALMSLVVSRIGGQAWLLTLLGLFGAALLYGDGVITPAISVLSALEGINVATDIFKPYVLPATLVVLFGLFAAQTRGTATIGRVFGPVMLLWFVTIGVLGLAASVREPRVLLALNPLSAAGFLVHHGWHSFVVLGGVFLAVTGGEALYADMGGVGRNPIRSGWYVLVLPSLLLCYAGQTALLISDPKLEGNPFFQLAPHWAVVPLVALATLATIIASQAIITGAFSLTRQAMQLGWFPGMNVRQTSDREYGQIYVGAVNWTMMVCTIVLAYSFGSSDKLARRRLWHGGVNDHAADDRFAVQCDARRLALGGAAGGPGLRVAACDGPGLLRCKPAEAARGRLGPAGPGRVGAGSDAHLASRYRGCALQSRGAGGEH